MRPGFEPYFEKEWQERLAAALEPRVGTSVRESVMAGGAELSAASSPEEIERWTIAALERIDACLDDPVRRAVLGACACSYPREALTAVQQVYAETGDLDQAHRLLQEQFEAMLRQVLGLDEEQVAEVRRRGLGSAGVRQGEVVVATKIPRGPDLAAWLAEADPGASTAALLPLPPGARLGRCLHVPVADLLLLRRGLL